MSELFTVRLSTGHEQRYTLDELDTAYKGGFIDEKTLVKPSTSARWMTLGELAGIEEEASPPSIAPMAIDAPLDVPVEFESSAALSSSEIPAELRPRKTGRIFAIGIAVVAVIGLGVAATRGASTIASTATALKAKIVTSSAEAPKAAAAMAPTPAPAPEKPTERQGTTTTTTPNAPSTITTDKLPNAAPQASSAKTNVPTMSAASLPDAKDKKKPAAPAKSRTRK